MTAIALPPDLERFATEAVASGRYRDLPAVVEAGVNLLRRTELARTALLASVQAARDEGDRVGYQTAEELTQRIEAVLGRRTQP